MSDPDWITPDVSLDITVRLDTPLRVYDLYLGNHLLDEASDVSRATINAQAASKPTTRKVQDVLDKKRHALAALPHPDHRLTRPVLRL